MYIFIISFFTGVLVEENKRLTEDYSKYVSFVDSHLYKKPVPLDDDDKELQKKTSEATENLQVGFKHQLVIADIDSRRPRQPSGS